MGTTTTQQIYKAPRPAMPGDFTTVPMGAGNPFAELVPPQSPAGWMSGGTPQTPAAGMTPPARPLLTPLPQLPASKPAPAPMGSRIPTSSEDSFGLRDSGIGLAGRAVRPIGRSMAEAPERRLEQAARQGNLRAASELVGLKQAGMQRDFQREMNQTNFGQHLQMYDLQRRDQTARDEQQRQDRFDQWNADRQARMDYLDQAHQNYLQMFGLRQGADAMQAERQRQQQEADRNRVPNVGFTPIPGSDYGIPTADGRPMGTVPVHTGTPPFEPTPEQIKQNNLVPDFGKTTFWNGKHYPTWKTGKAEPEKIKIHDGKGKVIDWEAGYEVPEGWTEVKKKGEAAPAATPAAPAGQGGWKALIPQGA